MRLTEKLNEMHDAAVAATGYDDFGPNDYIEPLKLILADVDSSGRASEANKRVWVSAVTKQLIGRLFAYEGFKKYPEAAAKRVRRPIVIVGMMRTGSTALHRLLSRDPQNQTLELWLADAPMKRPPRSSWADNPWYQSKAAELDFLRQANPRLLALHPQDAGECDECHIAMQKSLWWAEAFCFHTPEYRNWFLSVDPRFAFEFYQKTLGVIGAGDERRWVLKDPPHIFALDALMDVFPDACVVFTHRDIVSSVGASASLTRQFRALIDDNVTLAEQGRDIMEIWGEGLNRAEKARRRYDPAQFFDVHIDQLHEDPVGLVETIYRHFGIPFPDESRAALEAHVAGDPRIGHGKNEYRLEDYGITEDIVRKCSGEYYERNLMVCEELGRKRLVC